MIKTCNSPHSLRRLSSTPLALFPKNSTDFSALSANVGRRNSLVHSPKDITHDFILLSNESTAVFLLLFPFKHIYMYIN